MQQYSRWTPIKYYTLTDLPNVVCSLTAVLDDTQDSCLHQGQMTVCYCPVTYDIVVLLKHQHPPSGLLPADQCSQSPAKQRHD